MLRFDCCFTTDTGSRNANEDNFYLNGNYKRAYADSSYEKYDLMYNRGLFAVCDGMGGAEFGARAAYIAVENLKNYQEKNFNDFASEYIYNSNKFVYNMTYENNGASAGSTLALMYIENGKATYYNIGNSRIYLFRKGKLIQLSEDHTQTAQMVKMGTLPAAMAATHNGNHVLTRYLGINPTGLVVQAYIGEINDIQHDDIILMCSDGLTNMLTDNEIQTVLKSSKELMPAKHYTDILKGVVLERGAKDNFTIGIIKVMGKKKKFMQKLFGK